MKKLFLFGLMATLVFACKEDDEGTTNGDGSDSIDVKARQNALLLTGYGPGDPGTVNYERIRRMAEFEYKGRLNHMSLVVESANPLYNGAADTIRSNFQSLSPPFYVMDSEEVTLAEIFDATETSTSKKPLLAVGHKVSSTDTAWVIDSKVKFYEDTASSGIYIETYMLGKIRAKNYNGINLNVPEINNVTSRADSASFWDTQIMSVDSSSTIIKKGDPYFHEWLLIDHFSRTSSWGTQLAEYWPFGPDFYENDVIGTLGTKTNIRHYFSKPDKGDYTFDFQPQFITVVWILNPNTSSWEYVNSISTDKI